MLLLLSIFICAHIVCAGVNTELKKDGELKEESYEKSESKSLKEIKEERASKSKSERLKIREEKREEEEKSKSLNLVVVREKITKLSSWLKEEKDISPLLEEKNGKGLLGLEDVTDELNIALKSLKEGKKFDTWKFEKGSEDVRSLEELDTSVVELLKLIKEGKTDHGAIDLEKNGKVLVDLEKISENILETCGSQKKTVEVVDDKDKKWNKESGWKKNLNDLDWKKDLDKDKVGGGLLGGLSGLLNSLKSEKGLLGLLNKNQIELLIPLISEIKKKNIDFNLFDSVDSVERNLDLKLFTSSVSKVTELLNKGIDIQTILNAKNGDEFDLSGKELKNVKGIFGLIGSLKRSLGLENILNLPFKRIPLLKL